ncbi:hypothetical protein ACLOJK_014267 [Asimina triloba]
MNRLKTFRNGCTYGEARQSKEADMMNQLAPKQEPEEEEAAAAASWEKKAKGCFQTGHLGPTTRETDLRLGLSGFDEEEGGGGGDAKGVVGQKAFVLRQRNDGFGDKRWFEETGSGSAFGDAWKQEKAVFEPSNHQRGAPVVGWPPVRTFRKNLTPPVLKATSTPAMPMPTKPAAAVDVATNKKVDHETMFVKVNLEGYAVGRKINLKAHHSYESLSRALLHMFENFFSIDYFKDREQNKEDKLMTPNHVLIYEDNEGDRMLVGDVPWERVGKRAMAPAVVDGFRFRTMAGGPKRDVQGLKWSGDGCAVFA